MATKAASWHISRLYQHLTTTYSSFVSSHTKKLRHIYHLYHTCTKYLRRIPGIYICIRRVSDVMLTLYFRHVNVLLLPCPSHAVTMPSTRLSPCPYHIAVVLTSCHCQATVLLPPRYHLLLALFWSPSLADMSDQTVRVSDPYAPVCLYAFKTTFRSWLVRNSWTRSESGQNKPPTLNCYGD